MLRPLAYLIALSLLLMGPLVLDRPVLAEQAPTPGVLLVKNGLSPAVDGGCAGSFLIQYTIRPGDPSAGVRPTLQNDCRVELTKVVDPERRPMTFHAGTIRVAMNENNLPYGFVWGRFLMDPLGCSATLVQSDSGPNPDLNGQYEQYGEHGRSYYSGCRSGAEQRWGNDHWVDVDVRAGVLRNTTPFCEMQNLWATYTIPYMDLCQWEDNSVDLTVVLPPIGVAEPGEEVAIPITTW